MLEQDVDIWSLNKCGEWVCVTTNGMIKKDGTAVMGKGVAEAAANLYPELPRQLAGYLGKYGNRVFIFPKFKLITFPTKHDFRYNSDLELIKKSCNELMAVIEKYGIAKIYLPRPGCKNGGLVWPEVRKAIAPLLDDRVTVCEFTGKAAAPPVPQSAQLSLFEDLPEAAPEAPAAQAAAADGSSDPSQYTNHSGGAYGADTEWDVIGRRFGVTRHRHYRDQGNTTLSKRLRQAGVAPVLLTEEELELGYQALESVYGKSFERSLPNNLKARNFYQVENAQAVFAIGFLKGSKAVKGGTDAAVQFGIRQGKPVYVFDLKSCQWHVWSGERFAPCGTPVLTRQFAGVGSRDIEDYQVMTGGAWGSRPQYVGDVLAESARRAIESVYMATFGAPASA